MQNPWVGGKEKFNMALAVARVAVFKAILWAPVRTGDAKRARWHFHMQLTVYRGFWA